MSISISISNSSSSVDKGSGEIDGESSHHHHRVVDPIDVRFESITLAIESAAKKKKKKVPKKYILREVSGRLRAGSVTAIMGASGAGKTSLINVIAGRLRGSAERELSGTICMNGVRVKVSESAFAMKRLAGLVMQSDVLLPELSVEEQLQFTVRMTLPNASSEEKAARVEEVIGQLRLKDVRTAQTGMPGSQIRGVSGGERKRVAIAQELLRRPALLILDEPLSGLDSATALHVVELLKDIAVRFGHTIVMSVHQPSSTVFQLFDDLILMRRGRIVYGGAREGARDVFERLDHPVPHEFNPADHYIDVLSDESLPDDFGQSMLSDNNDDNDIDGGGDDDDDDDDDGVDDGGGAPISTTRLQRSLSTVPQVRDLVAPFERARPSFAKRFAYLTARSWRATTRNPLVVIGKFVQYFGVSAFSAMIFAQLGDDSGGIVGKTGALFAFCMLFSFMPANGVVLALPSERSVFLRESVQRLYSPVEYFLAKSVTLLPFDLLWPTIAISLSYFIIGLRASASAFFLQLLVLVTVTSMGSSIGLCVGAIVEDTSRAMELAPSLIIPQMLIAGLFTTDLPVWIDWTKYISYLYWAFQCVMQTEFGGQTLDESSSLAPTGQGDEVLDFYGVEYSFGMSFALLLSFTIVVRSLALVFFHFVSKRQSVEA